MKEKDDYKGLFESKRKSSFSEDELNKTIDFFKIENAKLGDQIIKLFSELKKKDENWIGIFKIHFSKLINYFESTLISKIKMHIENKFAQLDEKISKLLKFVNNIKLI